MRAHISNQVKARCLTRGIEMMPGGLTPYFQAGDIGVFKSFKDILCESISAWKTSGDVQHTRGGNPQPPNAWRRTPDLVIDNSIRAVGLSPTAWHTWRHDVYGNMFQRGRNSNPSTRPQRQEKRKGRYMMHCATVWMTSQSVVNCRGGRCDPEPQTGHDRTWPPAVIPF
ncbi:TPA: hypothetical protein N0F65_009468 [Lagenidium giganteum]|uniref:Uncharacterized protein n=1 Tax=Lagenidium giganteum TaxID=4803 RepID=A0AAV2ZHC8_9STRA|nr:TPA: hypothetical protein N0F65_009468 [Lagenidium giganteum]